MASGRPLRPATEEKFTIEPLFGSARLFFEVIDEGFEVNIGRGGAAAAFGVQIVGSLIDHDHSSELYHRFVTPLRYPDFLLGGSLLIRCNSL